MSWLPIVGLALGALLAQRFKIFVLLPATLALAIVAFGIAAAQMSSASSAVLIVVLTIGGMQAGYFVGMLGRRGMTAAGKLWSFSQSRSAQDPLR